MTDRRPLIALFAVVVVMVAVFLFTQSRDNSSAAPAITTTTSTVAPTPGDTTSSGLKQPVGNGADWQAGLARVTDLENKLFENPDPSRVGEFMTQSCTCYQETVDRLTALKAAGHHVAGANIILKDPAFLGQTGTESAPRAEVLTDIVSGGFATVDSAGKTVEAAPSSNQLPFRYFLDKGSDGNWRISDRGAVGGN